MTNTHPTTPTPLHLLGIAAGTLLLATSLASCASGGGTSGTSGGSSTSSGGSAGSSTSSASGSTTTDSPTSTATSPTSASGSGTTSSTGGSSSAGSSNGSTSPSPAALPSCTAAMMRTQARTQPGGAGAGSFIVQILSTNTSSTVCRTRGYPGVSLTAPGTGKQLGAAADRESGQPMPTMRLEPGKTAVALVKVAQAGNFGCRVTRAAGFRVYLPGDKAAEFAPYAVQACASASVHQLAVRPFNT